MADTCAMRRLRGAVMSVQPVFDVIVCGSLHLDIVVQAPALPRIDETAVGHGWKRVCGGKGGNQAVQAARAGARTAMIGRIGEDDFGATLRGNLVAAGVDVSGVEVDPVLGSGMSVAILQDDGDYGAVIVSGANTAIDPGGLAHVWGALGAAKVVVLQNEVPHAVNVAMARLARDGGARVMLNAAPARDLRDDLLPLVDVLVLNRVEASALSGMAVDDRASARAALPLLRREAGAVIITLSGEGLVVADAGGSVNDILPVPVRVTSTHGAGDCFAGALAARLAHGVALSDACRIANAKAAEFVSRTV